MAGATVDQTDGGGIRAALLGKKDTGERITTRVEERQVMVDGNEKADGDGQAEHQEGAGSGHAEAHHRAPPQGHQE
jgi:hypothetical protein